MWSGERAQQAERTIRVVGGFSKRSRGRKVMWPGERAQQAERMIWVVGESPRGREGERVGRRGQSKSSANRACCEKNCGEGASGSSGGKPGTNIKWSGLRNLSGQWVYAGIGGESVAGLVRRRPSHATPGRLRGTLGPDNWGRSRPGWYIGSRQLG